MPLNLKGRVVLWHLMAAVLLPLVAARASDVPGVGLGLAICRVLVEGQGGSIAVSNSPGGGATFHIRLPLAV